MSSSAWLDNSASSDDSVFFAPSGNIYSRSSEDTLDINDIPALDKYDSIITESLTLDSLSSADFVSRGVPRLPCCPSKKRTRSVLLSLASSLVIPKNGRRRRKHPSVLISRPTPERLRTVAQLKPAFDAWMAAILQVEPPDSIPWSPTPDLPVPVWTPEGSFFPPSYLKSCLRELHRHAPSPTLSNTAEASTLLDVKQRDPQQERRIQRRASYHPQTQQKTAVVLETKANIASHGKGKLRRWSVSVPASYMNAELAERRLELQRLEACMRGDVAQLDANVALLSEEMKSLVPEIKVSTSTATLPFSVLSAPSSPGNPLPLAVRRGQKVPAALALRRPKPGDIDLYPGIPTAFLGSPTNYSPDFQVAHEFASTIGVGDMVESLRSKVASFKPVTPHDERVQEILSPLSSNTPLSTASSNSALSEDEWGFAQDLLTKYGDKITSKMPNMPARPSARKSLGSRLEKDTPKSGKSKPPLSSPGPPRATVSKDRPKSIPAARGMTTQRTPRRPMEAKAISGRPVSGRPVPRSLVRPSPTSTPCSQRAKSVTSSNTPVLPDRPPLQPVTPMALPAIKPCLSPSKPKKIQGILKHAKSVRFAAPPEKEDVPPSLAQPPATLPRTAVKVKEAPAARQPSPLRECFAVNELEHAVKDVQFSTDGTTKAHTEGPNSRRQSHPALSSPRLSGGSPLDANDKAVAPSFHLPTGHLNATVENTPPTPSSASDTSSPPKSPRTRKSLALLFPDRDREKDKENKALPFRMSLGATPKHRRNENAGRRGSDAGTPRGVGSGRLSTPLKSIFGRLRA
ncbi:hypothetical protein BV25DRAFT_1900931 [Artomyces pyxidatus]|uniref:Uncharacterized protein n=1 Tax=Artomyces pyxidatus TaxID=48021 RepID=A0ACB8SXM9_9AGAM|nr:hypothetical protein BV25DRAFT_1900931 [Artomyces pyxidatus]